MKKLIKIMALALSLLMMATTFVACGAEVIENIEQETEGMNNETEKETQGSNKKPSNNNNKEEIVNDDGTVTFNLSYNFRKVKMLGRSSVDEAGIICDHSASGIEFNGVMNGDVYVDLTTRSIKSGCNTTYFTVYIDGERQPERLSVDTSTGTLRLARFTEAGEHTIKLVKQTESNYTICLIKALRFDGVLTNAPSDKDLYIEFIGDSLTCGMGNIGTNANQSDAQTPKWEDATQSYGYMIAEELNADYSIIAQSGIGIAGGWSNYPMADYYAAHSYTRDKDIEQDFSRVPDVVVINLGTNDHFINKDKDPKGELCLPEDVERMAEELILQVRESYGSDVPIIWAQGMVGEFLLDRIYAAINKLGGEDADIYTCTLPKNTGGAQWHPTVEGHEAAAEALLPVIKQVLNVHTRTIELATEYDMVKTHGRTALSDNGIYCDFTASGIEFTGEMVGDVYVNLTTKTIKSNSPKTYFTVYIDGQRVSDPNRTGSSAFAVTAGARSIKVASFDTLGEHTIKILKQTESNYNICEMNSITLRGFLTTPPADKELYIEFIGDSLTCGMGNLGDGNTPSNEQQSSIWEDGTQSYGYMVAQQLDADYSIISQSGIGIAGGWSNYPMETYFTAQSYTRDKEVKQKFTRVPDLIVINLGTNDYFINKDKDPKGELCKPEDVERMTEELILLVRECYGTDVPILWAQGMVGTFVLDRIQNAIDKVGGEAAGVYTYFSLPKNTGGAQGHPTVAGHTAAATAILPEIKKILGIN